MGTERSQPKDIKEGHCFIGNSIAGDELTIDTLDVTVKSFDTQFFPLTDSDGYLLWIQTDTSL